MRASLVLLLSALILISGVSILIKRGASAQRDPNFFLVGTAAGYAPWVSINEQGEYEGFDIDVAHALAKQMGKELVLKDLGSMAFLFTSLDQGAIDAIIWGISITPDRLKKVSMVNYQGDITNAYPLLFWNKLPEGVATVADMKDKTVCVESASAQDMVLNKYAFINKLSMERVDDCLLNIQYAKADAALVEPAIAKKFQNRYPEIKILEVPLAPDDQVQGVGIVINKDNKELTAQVQDAVTVLKSTGIIANLEQKWDIPS